MKKKKKSHEKRGLSLLYCVSSSYTEETNYLSISKVKQSKIIRTDTCCMITFRLVPIIPTSWGIKRSVKIFSHHWDYDNVIFRDVEEKAASMSGRQEMVVAMTTAIAMVMPQACGQSPSILPSMTGVLPCTMRAAPPLWHRHSATDAKETQRLVLWVCLHLIPSLMDVLNE